MWLGPSSTSSSSSTSTCRSSSFNPSSSLRPLASRGTSYSMCRCPLRYSCPMSACVVGLCAEDDCNAPARDDSAWCTPTEVPVIATKLLDGGALHGALTTTLPPGVDPAGVGDGPECVRSENVLCSPVATLLLTLHFITPSAAVDCNAPSVVTSVGRGRGALLRGVSQFATTGAATTL
jgi:hypothetical protein